MIEKAAARALYDALEVGELARALDARPGHWDLLLAADVFVYVGELQTTFAQARTALRPGGWLLFSVERGEASGFVLRQTGRYVRGEDYLRRLVEAGGFVLRAREEAVLRREQGADVHGWLYALQVPGG